MSVIYSSTPSTSRPSRRSSSPRALYTILNVLAFTPILGGAIIFAISYANPDYAEASNIAYFGFTLAPLAIVTVLSLPINAAGAIYFGIRKRDRALALTLSACFVVVAALAALAALLYSMTL